MTDRTTAIDQYLRSKPAKNLPAGFWEGLMVPWRGYQFMSVSQGLWRFGVTPVCLNILISIAMLFLLYEGTQSIWAFLLPYLPAGAFGVVLKVLAAIAIFVLAVGLVIALWFLLGAIFCGFFYSRLAREVELKIGTPADALREVPLLYEVSYALRTAILLVTVNSVLLVLHLVPIIGSTLSGGLTFYFDCFLFGWEYFDYPLALRAKSYAEKKQFAKSYRGHTLGMGASIMLFTFIPIIGAVFLTTAVVGSVLLHHRIEKA